MISLSMLTSDSAFASHTDKSILLRPCNNIIIGDSNSAVTQTINIENDENCDVVKNVGTELLSDDKRNLVVYAYELWKEGLQKTVKNQFPNLI